MSQLSYKDNKTQIKRLLELLKCLSPSDDTYEYLMNELLIQVYTSYENFLKTLLSTVFLEAKKNYRYSPFLIEHNLWHATEGKNYVVPKGSVEALFKHYPILKNSYYSNDLNAIDTLVSERNSFAHTGTHKATLEQILTAYVTTQYVINYLDFCYLSDDPENSTKLSEIQTFLKNLSTHTRACLKKIKIDTIPENMQAFDSYIEKLNSLQTNGYFSIHPILEETLTEERFEFLKNYKGSMISDFYTGLEGLEKAIYFSSFKVQNKDNVNIDQVLNILEVNDDDAFEKQQALLSKKIIVELIENEIAVQKV